MGGEGRGVELPPDIDPTVCVVSLTGSLVNGASEIRTGVVRSETERVNHLTTKEGHSRAVSFALLWDSASS